MSLSVEQIQAAYTAERARNAVAETAEQLPLSYESITDRWLTAILCATVPGAQVLEHSLSAPDTGSSNRRKIYLRYNAAGEQARLPTAVFCKASHELANRVVLGVSGAAQCETLFYTHIRASLPIEAPQCFYARLDPASVNSMIVLNDLTDQTLEFCDHRTQITRARAESQMRLLGTLHGRCYADAHLQAGIAKFPTFSEFFGNTLKFGMREGSDAGFLAGEDVIPPGVYARHAEVWPATLAAIARLDEQPRTLAHGDVHLKNWYVLKTGEMGLGDWQCCARAQWGRDVAYTLATALTVANRRAWERELLGFYLQVLAEAGGPRIGFDAAFDHYRQQLIPALTWWTVTLCPTPDIPDMQPKEVSIEFIKRIATAMDDLQSLDVR